MRSLNAATIVALLALGLGLGAANVWYAAVRSTIPLALQGRVTDKRLGIEKHPGVDDAPMIAIDNGATFPIDRDVFERLSTGDEVTKAAWDSQLQVNAQRISLAWSKDFFGLVWCMAAAVVIMLVVALVPSRPRNIIHEST